tara:strand:- start:1077 stop:1313 length:237 start_codon:yes stop_codon:yes gene_type:complete
MNINPQLLFNSSITFSVAGFLLFFKGFFLLGITGLAIAITSGLFWFMSGLFDKFESTPPEIESEEDKDEEGKGILKPF